MVQSPQQTLRLTHRPTHGPIQRPGKSESLQGFQLLRLALGVGSLLMLLVGLRLAMQPQTVPVRDVKTGINQLVEEGHFAMTPTQKPVVPGLALLWGGFAGLALTVLVPTPQPLVSPSHDDTNGGALTGRATSAITPIPAASIQAMHRAVKGTTLQDFWSQGVKFPRLAERLDLGARLALLDTSLSQHEEGWIDRLLCCPCLLVIARPGSAKSSFAAALAMCRELLLPELKMTVAVDPNAHLKADRGIWQQHWQLVGAHDNWLGIGEAIATLYRRFADSQGENYVSSIYDELTAYYGNVNPDHLGGLLPQITSKARDSQEYLTLISHSDTLTCLGGKAGQAKLKDDMVQLNLGSKSAKRGKFVPTGTGTIEGLEFDERNKPLTESITLPRWFDPVILATLFPEVYGGNEHHGRGHEEAAESSGNEDGYTVVTDDVTGGSGNASEPPVLPADNQPGTEEGNGRTAYAARLAAARKMQERIKQDLAVEPEIAALLAAMTALVTGQSESSVIKEVLGLKGRNYDLGKSVLQVIKESIRHSEN